MTPRTGPAIKERPMYMSAPSVLAFLDGRKTETRRAIGEGYWLPEARFIDELNATILELLVKVNPHGMPGDRLWVRETIRRRNSNPPTCTYLADCTGVVGARAPETYIGRAVWQWPKLSTLARIPRWASRILLEIVTAKVERAWDITEEGALAEGIRLWEYGFHWIGPSEPPVEMGRGYETARDAYAAWWDALNAKRGYPYFSNPYVWAYQLKRIEAPAP